MQICQHCHNEFKDPKHKEKKYCSIKCFHSANPRKIKVCPTCKKTFPIDYWKVKYCSRKCKGIDKRKRIQRVCKNCRKTFSIKPADKQIFCSIKCRVQGLIDPNKKAVISCKVCKKEFISWSYRNRSCCSKKCASVLGVQIIKANAKYQSIYGKNWKGQKAIVHKRDKCSCRSCGTHGFILGRAFDVHHIKPVNSFNGDWRKANEIKNLVTLCRSCHRDVHAHKIQCPRN